MRLPAAATVALAATGALGILLVASGCSEAQTEGTDGVTFRAEATSLCADADLTHAIVGVGIEMHGARGGTIDDVEISKDGTAVDDSVWLLDTFNANHSVADTKDATGWAMREKPAGAELSPGSHTLAVQLDRLSSGPETAIDRMAVTYTIDGQTGIAVSTVALGFGEPGDHSCN